MEIETIATDRVPAPGGSYSHARAFGDFVFVAGEVGIDPSTGVAPSDTRGQVEQAIRNLEQVLLAAGARLADVVKTTCFLPDMADFAEFDAVYRQYFGAPYPARSTVSAGLVRNLLFEIEAIAVRRSSH